MCQICQNDYSLIETTSLYLSSCHIIQTLPNFMNIHTLVLFDCINIHTIPHYPNLSILSIIHNKFITDIPNFNYLNNLYLDNCYNIKTLGSYPTLKSLSLNNIYIDSINIGILLTRLHLVNCNYLRNIKFKYLYTIPDINIKNCINFHNFRTQDSLQSITTYKYLNIIKIIKWWRRMKYLHSNHMKILWQIAEYYCAKKYAPMQILHYINLNN